MKKEITVYELLGLIKDDKAPKIVKWEGYMFSFYNNDYLCINEDFIKNRETNYLLCYLFGLPESPLNIKVEIIEEPKELEEIEFKFNNGKRFMISNIENINYEVFIDTKELVLATKINEIIRYIKDKENK